MRRLADRLMYRYGFAVMRWLSRAEAAWRHRMERVERRRDA